MNRVELQAHAEGVILPVKAQPGARKSGIVGVHGGALKVAVTAVAEKGKANAAIVAVLAKALRLAKSDIELVAGHTASQKRFLLRGAKLDDVQRAITQVDS